MGKTIVLGDVHGRNIWKDIVNDNYDADCFVFLGDYVSTHDYRYADPDIQIDNLKDILDFAEFENAMTPGRVILLRGNHDMQHLGYHWAECSGINWHVQDAMMKMRERFINNTQWVYVEDNIVYSHAGISERWMQDNKLTDVNQINDLEPSEKFGFTPCKLSDYCGDSVTQPPTWIRPWALFGNAFGDYTYIVGHTTEPHITFMKDASMKQYKESYFDDMFPPDPNVIKQIEESNEIIVCDCLGSGEYLIVENEQFTIGKIEEL